MRRVRQRRARLAAHQQDDDRCGRGGGPRRTALPHPGDGQRGAIPRQEEERGQHGGEETAPFRARHGVHQEPHRKPGEHDAVRGSPLDDRRGEPGGGEEHGDGRELHRREHQVEPRWRSVQAVLDEVVVDAPHEVQAAVHRLLPGGVGLRVLPGGRQEGRPVEADPDRRRDPDQLRPSAGRQAPRGNGPQPEVGDHRNGGEEEEVLGGEHARDARRCAELPPVLFAAPPVIGRRPGFRDAPQQQHEEEAEQRVFLRDALVADVGGGHGRERRGAKPRRPSEQTAAELRHDPDRERSRQRIR